MLEPRNARYERGTSLTPSASMVSISTAARTVPDAAAEPSPHPPLGCTLTSNVPLLVSVALPSRPPLPAAKLARPTDSEPVLKTNGPSVTGALVRNSTSTSVLADDAGTTAVRCPLPPTTTAVSRKSGLAPTADGTHDELTFARKRYLSTTAYKRYSASFASLLTAPSRASPYPLR